jgi:DnaK suppressor protein
MSKIFVANEKSFVSLRGLRSGPLVGYGAFEGEFHDFHLGKTTVSANKGASQKAAAKKPASKAPVPARSGGGTSAASILGRPPASSHRGAGPTWTPVSKVKAEWQKYYQNLLDLHTRLRDQMSGLAKESQSEMESYSLHMGDSGTDNFDRDFALSLLSSDQDALYEIEEALKRIEKGTYGICELTGKPIPRARLDAIPWARFTVEAQAQLEKEGALKQRRLGQLGSVETGAAADADDGDDEPEERPAAKEKE